MKKILASIALLMVGSVASSATIFINETDYLNALAALGYTVITEGFDDDIVWADSRSPSTTLSVTSRNITWTSNQPTNRVNTGALGGSVVDGAYGFFSNPHGDDTDSGLYCDDAQDPIPVECWLNDGWIVTAPDGETLHGVGGWFDSNTGVAKVTFLLDGVDVNGNDTDNIDNWNRDGDFIDGWTFVGVIDIDGFTSAEILELSGKDFQQKFIFSDKFSIGVELTAGGPLDVDGNGIYDALTDGLLVIRYLFGLTGAPLINSAVGASCTRCTAKTIEEYLKTLTP